MQQPNRNNFQGRQGGGFNQRDPRAADFYAQNLTFNPQWITDKADKDLIVFAETAGRYMANNKLTNTRIRNIYGEIKRIQMGTFKQEKSAFFLLKPKVAYTLGRDANNEGLKLFKIIFDSCYDYVEDEKSYKNFCNVIEAILAYHKAYGGKD